MDINRKYNCVSPLMTNKHDEEQMCDIGTFDEEKQQNFYYDHKGTFSLTVLLKDTYSRVRNKRTGTFINFRDFFPTRTLLFRMVLLLDLNFWNGYLTFSFMIKHELSHLECS